MYVSREIHALTDFIPEECVTAWLDTRIDPKLLVSRRNVRTTPKPNPYIQAAFRHELCCQITVYCLRCYYYVLNYCLIFSIFHTLSMKDTTSHTHGRSAV